MSFRPKNRILCQVASIDIYVRILTSIGLHGGSSIKNLMLHQKIGSIRARGHEGQLRIKDLLRSNQAYQGPLRLHKCNATIKKETTRKAI